MERRSESNAPAVLAAIAALLFAILVASYTVGYFALPERIVTGDDARWRVYKARWLEMIYRPAAYAESIVTGREVQTAYSSYSEGD